jgi:hypothetical protein
MGRLLGRSIHSVRDFCYRNDITIHWYAPAKSRRVVRRWTPAEWNYALQLSRKYGLQKTSDLMGRTRASVWGKFKYERLRFDQGLYSATDAARICNCSVPWACRVASKLQLPSTQRPRSGRRYRLAGRHLRILVRAIRPGRAYLCEGL